MANTQRLTRKVFEIDKPIIAAVNGAAVGGGVVSWPSEGAASSAV